VCGEQGRFGGGPITGGSNDVELPVSRVLLPGGAADTVVDITDSLKFTARTTDNVRVATMRVRVFALTGFALDTVVMDTTTTATVLTVQKDFTLPLPQNSAGGRLAITIVSTDAAGNGNRDSVAIRVDDPTAPELIVRAPTGPVTVLAGSTLQVIARAEDPSGIARMGARLFTRDAVGNPVTMSGDSTDYATRLTIRTDTFGVVIPGSLQPGRYTVHAFVMDSSTNLNDTTSADILVTVADTVRPTVQIFQPAAAAFPVTVGDSVFVHARLMDNGGVVSATITGRSVRGVDSLGTRTNVTRFTSKTTAYSGAQVSRDTMLYRYLLAVLSDSTSEIVNIVVAATDSSGNVGVDSATVRIVRGPVVSIARPTAGTTTSAGKSIVIEVRANDADGVRYLGWRISGVLAGQDSTFRSPVSGQMPDTATFIDTLNIPVGTPLGTLTLVPFASDSLGDPSGSTPGVTLTVESAASDVTPPTVRFAVGRRIETDDSIVVSATDAGGITRVGWTATLLGGAVVATDTTTPALPGTLSDVSQTFSLNLPGAPVLRFPAQVVVRAFALDLLGNVGFSVAETLTVVAGKTYTLPIGSQIGDAIYNANRQELYLANTALDRIEIFSLASSSFVGYVPVGSRPMGLAMFPRDSLGAYKDTLIVANSGGTNLSIVDLVNRREIRRHRLPNWIVQTIKTQTNGGGGLDIIITEYEFSDRPFHIGATCVTGATARCDRVRVLYSTTPTLAQTTPFPERGFLAWTEIDTIGTFGLGNHFVYEHASGGVDTLQLIAINDTMPGEALRDTILGAGIGRLVNINTLAFRDSTFVRNSGDFLHGVVGEGGEVAFARALTFDVRPGLVYDTSTAAGCTLLGFPLKCGAFRDAGVSSIVQVSDFVASRAARVTAVSTNFNGRTNLIRADSIYVFDHVLRQTGMLQVGSSGRAVGLDLHPSNNFDATVRGTGGIGGTGSPSNRMVFAARPDSSIDVFDTYFYGRVTDTTSTASTIPVPIRNALIGPVRVADVTGTTTLFGVTAYGLVVVNLPTVTNSLFPVRQMTTRRD
jgi:hypothetical protein